MRYIVFDSESDGLWKEATKIHVFSWTEDGKNINATNDVEEIAKVLSQQDTMFVCHNAIRHDMPLFNKLSIGNTKYTQYVDTLALSWYLHYDRMKHGLESYGIDYGVPKPKIDDWQGLTYEEYRHRNIEDVKINWKLWKDLEAKLKVLYPDEKERLRFIQYLSFKMDCARAQEESGVYVDTEKASRHLSDISEQLEEKYTQLREVMPKVPNYETKTFPAKPYKKDGSLSSHGMKWLSFLSEQGLPLDTKSDVTYVKDYEEPNPQSDVQIKNWLSGLGWVCRNFKFERNKETGEEKSIPQIRYPKNHPQEGELCEEILELIEVAPEVELLNGMSILKHRRGFFQGIVDNAVDGKLFATIDGFTNTLRFTHRKPMANIPSVGKPWGEEIRSCFVAPAGKKLCGADMVSLEDTTKRHYMKPLDPQYVEAMEKEGFDPHLDLAIFAGAISAEDAADHVSGKANFGKIRKLYKQTNYSAVYGVGGAKLSRETGLSLAQAKKLLEDYWSRNWAVREISKNCEVKVTGKSMWLKNPVSGFYYQLRYDKDRFSTLNQSTGVYCFDTWLYYVRQEGINPVFQFHDEQGNYCGELDLEENSKALIRAIGATNNKLRLNINLKIDIKYGNNYAETH